MIHIKLYNILILSLFIYCNLYSQTADELVSKYIDSLGGINKINSINTLTVNGKFVFDATEVSFKQTYKRPLKVVMEAVFENGVMKQAFDGTTGWTINPFSENPAALLLKGEALKRIRKAADFEGALVNYKNKGNSIEFIGEEDYEGRPVYNLKLIDKEGDVSNFYIDAATFLLRKEILKIKFEDNTITDETILDDYRPENGIMLPYLIELRSPSNPNGSQTITIESVIINPAVEHDVFKFPGTIKNEEEK